MKDRDYIEEGLWDLGSELAEAILEEAAYRTSSPEDAMEATPEVRIRLAVEGWWPLSWPFDLLSTARRYVG